MCSRQYVAQVAAGCSAKGKTIAKLLAVVFFYRYIFVPSLRAAGVWRRSNL